MNRSLLQAATLSLGIFLLGCSAQGDDPGANQKTTEKPPVAVEVAKVATSEIREGIQVVGSLSPKFETDVRSEYTGIVSEVYVAEWVRVKKGAPLARLDTRESEVLLQKAKTAVEVAKANFLQAEVAANRASREYDRLIKLKEYGLVTQQNLDDGLTEKNAAEARRAAAGAQVRVAEDEVLYMETKFSKSVIRAPVDGVVSLRNVNVGDYVGEPGGKPMFRIVDNRVLNLIVTVPSIEMSKVRVGQALIFTTDALPGKTFRGKVMYINPAVNEADRSVKVVAEVRNDPEELKGGLFVKGRILTGQKRKVFLVPRAALTAWDIPARKGELFIVENSTARRRTVSTGIATGDSIEITTGLSQADQVVIRGGFNLQAGDKVNIIRVHGGS